MLGLEYLAAGSICFFCLTAFIAWIRCYSAIYSPDPEGMPEISLKKYLKEANTGDIVLFKGTTYSSLLVRSASASPFDHVALVFSLCGTKYVWHANAGVNVVDYFTGNKKYKAVQINTLKDLCKNFKGRGYVRKLKCPPQRHKEIQQDFIKTIVEIGAADFNGRWVDLLRTTWGKGGGIFGKAPKRKENSFFCSQLITRTLINAKILKKNLIDETEVHPKIFAGSRLEKYLTKNIAYDSLTFIKLK